MINLILNQRMENEMDLTNYCRAGVPFLFVESLEINRATNMIQIDPEKGYNKLIWDFERGLTGNPEITDAVDLIHHMANNLHKSIVIAQNFDWFLSGELVIQAMLNEIEKLKYNLVCLCIVGSTIKFPPQLEKMITLIEFPLPSVNEFIVAAKDYCEQTGVEFNQMAAENCSGLSMEEAEDAMALSIIENSALNSNTVMKMKRQIIKKTGFLDFFTPEPLDMIGGLDEAKNYFFKRLKAWEPDSKAPKLRSIFLVGIPGTGKSLIAKTMASIFGCPGIMFDISAIKSKYVGDSEANLRMAMKIIDAFGRSVIFIDEINKAFAGAGGSGEMDSGVSASIFGNFLTWLQESKGEKIIVATANNIKNLPSEFLRAGRWDQIFYVDFPSYKERKEIVDIQNKKWNANLPMNKDFIESLDGFTGAEIEQLAKESHFENDLNKLIDSLPILKRTRPEQITLIQKEGRIYTRANSVDSPGKGPSRKLDGNDLDLSETKRNIRKKILNEKK